VTPVAPYAVCLDLDLLQPQQVARWQLNVMANIQMEHILPLCLQQLKISSRTFGTSRDVPFTISLETHIPPIKSWIEDCLQNHSPCDIQSTPTVLPSRLLDIFPSPVIITNISTTDISYMTYTTNLRIPTLGSLTFIQSESLE
jgi:hypothetical protein